MSDSTHLALPFVEASQAQKHVTVNDAFTQLDALVHLAVEGTSETVPPLSPTEGARWIVGPSASGLWSGEDGKVAVFIDGAWAFLTAKAGWQVWDTVTRRLLVHDGAAWVTGPSGTVAALTHNSAATRIETVEIDHTILAGASNDTALIIPDRAIVFGVTGRVLTTISGPGSWTLGVGDDPGRYGNSIGVAGGSTVNGVSGTPTAYYGATPVRVTATGGDFTGGSLRLALHYLALDIPAA